MNAVLVLLADGGVASFLDAIGTIEKVFLVLLVVIGTAFWRSYPESESPLTALLKVGLLLGFVYGIIKGFDHLSEVVDAPERYTLFGLLGQPAEAGTRLPYVLWVTNAAVGVLVVMILWYARNKMGTIGALFLSIWDRGHWYVLPALFVLMFVGVLLVAAAASPVLSPFIYTLF